MLECNPECLERKACYLDVDVDEAWMIRCRLGGCECRKNTQLDFGRNKEEVNARM